MAIERKKPVDDQTVFDNEFDNMPEEEMSVEQEETPPAVMPATESSVPSADTTQKPEKGLDYWIQQANTKDGLIRKLGEEGTGYAARIAQLEAALAQAAQGQPSPAPAMPTAEVNAPQDKPAPAWGDYGDDPESYVTGEYGEEFSKAVMGIAEKAIGRTLGEVMPKILGQYTQSLMGQLQPAFENISKVVAPLYERQQAEAAREHEDKIKTAAPWLKLDDSEHVSKIQEFVANQPDDFRTMFQNVLENGTTEQVIKALELIGPATGLSTQASQAQPQQAGGQPPQMEAQAPIVNQQSVPPPQNQKVMNQLMASTAVPNGAHSGVSTQAGDPSSFDDVFNKITQDIKGSGTPQQTGIA